MIALCLLPLLYPLVDVASWQALAALAATTRTVVEPERRSAVLRGAFASAAGESSLMWLSIGMLGAIAVIAIQPQAGADVLQALVARLILDSDAVAASALLLLSIAVFALVLSTMSELFSAALCTIRYDVLPGFLPALAPARGASESTAWRRTLLAGTGLGVAVAAVFGVVDARVDVRFASSTFLALLFAFGCAQLALAPLTLGAIVGRMRGGSGSVGPGWALAIVAAGAAAAAAAAAVHVVTGSEAWLWAAAPACLGSGGLLFAIARLASRRRRDHSSLP